MEVEVRLFAMLRKGRCGRRPVDLPEGSNLGDLLAQLAIPAKSVSLPLVNGQHAKLAQPLGDGDVVALFPAIGGG